MVWRRWCGCGLLHPTEGVAESDPLYPMDERVEMVSTPSGGEMGEHRVGRWESIGPYDRIEQFSLKALCGFFFEAGMFFGASAVARAMKPNRFVLREKATKGGLTRSVKAPCLRCFERRLR